MMSTPCVLSTWRRNEKGYACRSKRVGKQVKKVYAHRLAWEAVHGPVPAGMTVGHNCGVKPCVNVAHLELQTISENATIGAPCKDKTCSCACHSA